MIKLTRLDGSEIYINSEIIEIIEETPDTHITLSNGNRYVVLETSQTIIEKIIRHKSRILRAAVPSVGKKYLRRERNNIIRKHRRLDD